MGIGFILLILCSFLLIEWVGRRLPMQSRLLFQTITCFAILVIFFCLRDLPVLNDTGHYYETQYLLVKKGLQNIDIFEPYNLRYEYLFQVWSSFIARYIWHDAYAIVFITSFLVSIANIWFISKYTTHIALVIFLNFQYMLFMNSANRQAYAIMLFYIGICLLIKRKYGLYYILIFIAYFFHSSAIILLIIPIFNKISLNKKNVYILFFIGIIISLLVYPLLDILGYSDTEYYVSNSVRKSLPIAQTLNFIWYALMLCAIYYIRKIYSIKFPYTIFTWLSTLCVIWQIIGIPFLVFSRFASYFQMIIVIELIYCIYHLSARTDLAARVRRYKLITRNNILALFIIFNMIKLCVITEYKNEWFHLVPYTFYDFAPKYHNYKFGY